MQYKFFQRAPNLSMFHLKRWSHYKNISSLEKNVVGLFLTCLCRELVLPALREGGVLTAAQQLHSSHTGMEGTGTTSISYHSCLHTALMQGNCRVSKVALPFLSYTPHGILLHWAVQTRLKTLITLQLSLTRKATWNTLEYFFICPICAYIGNIDAAS